MKRKAFKIAAVAAIFTSGFLASCVENDNSPGLEYMPDMYRSPAVEAYVDYGEVEGVYDEEAHKMVEEKFSFKPPVGTIPVSKDGEFLAPYNHAAPLNIGQTHGLFEVPMDSVTRDATKGDVNPIAWSEDVVGEGKVLFDRFCSVCHGEKGDGQGSVVTNSNGKYPTPGPYKKELTSGEIYYTITYGKNAMGSYASQVNPVERWKIVHYVEKLIGKEQKPAEEASQEPISEEVEGAAADSENEGLFDKIKNAVSGGDKDEDENE